MDPLMILLRPEMGLSGLIRELLVLRWAAWDLTPSPDSRHFYFVFLFSLVNFAPLKTVLQNSGVFVFF